MHKANSQKKKSYLQSRQIEILASHASPFHCLSSAYVGMQQVSPLLQNFALQKRYDEIFYTQKYRTNSLLRIFIFYLQDLLLLARSLMEDFQDAV